MVVDLGQKMDVMWSFIRTHLKAKTIIFLSTCKQVRLRSLPAPCSLCLRTTCVVLAGCASRCWCCQ